ncbi:hypothetical protein [Burkholderia gladioli]|uniref:hypothetical protein n=1 Tax=Burkholderia gladioli TaxID=28095 RepID=UPI001641AA79|nr:hypothetical protein [Burkholderia gladioli]
MQTVTPKCLMGINEGREMLEKFGAGVAQARLTFARYRGTTMDDFGNSIDNSDFPSNETIWKRCYFFFFDTPQYAPVYPADNAT